MNSTMQPELSIALNFVISYLYNKLPRRRVDMFCEELEKGLRRKFEAHWYPDEPLKGSGFRSVRLNGEKVDPVVADAAEASGLSVDEVQEYLPKSLTVWMDPGEVTYRTGESTPIKILYRRSGMGPQQSQEMYEEGVSVGDTVPEPQHTGLAFNPAAESFLPAEKPTVPSTLSTSPLGWNFGQGGSGASTPSAPGSSTSPIMGPYFGRLTPAQTQTAFTAASFAQTKFGSTKMKSQAQRPTRLSPTELAGGMFVPGGVVTARSPVSPMGVPQLSKLSPHLSSPLGGPMGPNLVQLSPVHQQQLMASPYFGLCAPYQMDYVNEQQQRMLMLQFQQRQLQEQQMQHKLHQQRQFQQQLQQQIQLQKHLQMEQQRKYQLNEIMTSEHIPASSPAEAPENSIAASIQLFYEQQQLLQKQQQQQQQQQEVESPQNEQILGSPVIEFSGERSADPFHTERSETSTEGLDWEAFVTPFTGGLHQLLVAN